IIFFFQAEDGIRDFHVTGVQTCALPIWPTTRSSSKCLEKRAVSMVAEVISVEGRTYPVEVRYRPLEGEGEGDAGGEPREGDRTRSEERRVGKERVSRRI